MPGDVDGPRGSDDFAAWVRPHLPTMRRVALRFAPAAEADDAVQDALVRAWRRWSTFDPERGTPSGWLLAIVADQARKRRRPAVVPLLVADGALESTGTERRLDLERAIAGLPARQRLAVDLHYFVGLDVRTCAEVMRCAEGTVKATLHQARRRLHDVLGDDDD